MELGRITAEGGCKHINAADGAQTGLGAYCIIAQEDTVISLLKGGTSSSDIGTNFLTTQGISGKTLKQGCQLFVPLSNTYNSLTVQSGSVMIYKLAADTI